MPGYPEDREMHLRLLLSLFTFLFLSNNAGAGGSGDGNDGGDDGGDSNDDNNDGKDDAAAGLKSALDKERSRAKTAERDLKAAQKRLDELDNASKSETEKVAAALKAAEDRASTAETRLRDANARSAVTEAAGKANAISTRAVYALIRSDLDFNDDGEPTNVSELIAQARKDEPSLFRAAAGSGDGGKGGEQKQDINSALRALARGGT